MAESVLPKLVLLIANERTGTHAFRSAMINSGHIAAPGEICNAEAQQQEPVDFSFFDFRRDYNIRFPNFSLPTYLNQERLLDGYFDFFCNKFRGEQFVICDIKYSQIHNFNNSWWDIFSEPDIVRFAKLRNIRVIHLLRRKFYQTAFSEIYATETGLWRTQDPKEIIHKTIKVDSDVLTSKAQTILRRMELVSQWLTDARKITIDYETLASKNGLAVVNEVNAFLNLPAASKLFFDFVKTTPDYQNIISNYEEIAPLLSIESN